jgi:hypothetical protein
VGFGLEGFWCFFGFQVGVLIGFEGFSVLWVLIVFSGFLLGAFCVLRGALYFLLKSLLLKKRKKVRRLI